MNTIRATITEIASKDKVSVVSFSVAQERLEMISLGVGEALAEGSTVYVGVKASNIILSASRVRDVSITNQIEVTVASVTMGSLLCSVLFTFEGVTWESIVTRKSAETMQLRVDTSIYMLIKSSDLSIVGVL